MRAEQRSPAAPARQLLVACLWCMALLLMLPAAPSAQAATCSNEAIRMEQGAAGLSLPDCRAYELVSSGGIVSFGKESVIDAGGGKASPEGNSLSYFSRYPIAGSDTSSETWLSNRTATGWIVNALDPQMSPNPTKAPCSPGVGLSEDLRSFVLWAGGELRSTEENRSGECGVPVEELVAGEPRGYSNLYFRREGGPYELVNEAPVGVTPANATYQAASVDLSHIVFDEDAMLTPGSVAGSNLFEWSEGTVREIGILPDGEHVSASLAAGTENWGASTASPLPGHGLAPISHAVSADGESVFFEADGSLYLRENAGQAPAAEADCLTTSESERGCTVQIDRSFGAGLPGGGIFQFASRSGDRVFFTSDHALTANASAQPGKPDLYEYNRNKAGANKLTDLTAKGQSEAANVRGISGGSEDGNAIYFVARGVLTGSKGNKEGEVALPGQPNLYLTHNGSLTYVATLSAWEAIPAGGRDNGNWWEAEPAKVGTPGAEDPKLKTAWSPSGNYLLFYSRKALTGFANAPKEPGSCQDEACEEAFLYDAQSEELSCVSCDPRGGPPVADTRAEPRTEFQRFGPPGPRYAPRAVLDNGEVFFETTNPLSPNDVNGFQDVYEYDAGVTSLISSGTGAGGSGFVDASADGRDVFFITSASLVRADGDGLPSVYDARIDGGFAEPPLPPAPCAGEGGCRAPAGPPPPAGTSSTSSVGGSGNVKPKQTSCRRGFVRKRGRCVSRSTHNKKPKKHSTPKKHAKKTHHGLGGKS